jgi:CRISPR system Cascade subunit CasB
MSDAAWTPGPADLALHWWRDLQDTRRDGSPNPRGDRAALARLRRAEPVDALTDEAVMDLYRRMFGPAFVAAKMKLAVRLALVLAHVRENGKLRFGEALGEGGDNAPLKPLRFKRLLLAESEEEIIRQFRRAVDLAGDVANVLDLARLLLDWTDPDRSEKTRTRLAFNYFGARTAADDEGTTARSQSTA